MAKLVVLSHRVPFPPNKGEKLRTFHQIEELVRLGHKVTVLAPIDDARELENATQLSSQLQIDVICKPLSNRLIRLALAVLTNKSFSETNFYCPALMIELKLQIKNADILLVTASSLASYALQLDAGIGIVKMMDFMDVDSDKWLQYARDGNYLKKLLYTREANKVKELEQKVANNFDSTFVIAETEKQLFKTCVGNINNMHVLGNGIDQTLFNPAASKPTKTINFLFSGVMDYKPNIDAVLWFIRECWPSIQQQVNNAHLIIAGMNPTPEIVKLGLQNNIEVTGFVDDIKPYFDKAHIFIAPFQIARGVQNKVLQAMACGLPVVSTPLGAEGILCVHNHDIVVAKTAAEFIKHCVMLSSDEKRRSDIGQRALSTINENYAWSSVLKPLTDLLKVT